MQIMLNGPHHKFSYTAIVWHFLLLESQRMIYRKFPVSSSSIVFDLKNLVTPVPFLYNLVGYFSGRTKS